MFSHVFLGVKNFERALGFYREILPALGLKERFCDPHRPWAGWQIPGDSRPLLLIGTPYNGQAHMEGNGQMLALSAQDPTIVQAVYEIALACGGICEGPPGLRPHYHANYFGAYFRDTEGNKLCVVSHESPS